MLIIISHQMMHQFLIQWHGDDVNVVQADASVNVATTYLLIWEFEELNAYLKQIGRHCIKIHDQAFKPIQQVGSESLF